jgi:Na+-transporting methylmalonyl-CoA/oxaloacetate decarboxylase gamma subunit
MRTILIILGMIFLIIIVLVATMIGVTAVKGSALDKESKAYVDSVVPRIVSNWDESELLSRASSEFMQATDKQELDKLYTLFRKLGKLRVYEGSKGQSYISMTIQNGKSVTAVYTCKADFDAGPADIKVSLIQHGGRWEVAGFNVDSEVFLRH